MANSPNTTDVPYFLAPGANSSNSDKLPLDDDWVRSSFLVGDSVLKTVSGFNDVYYRYWSRAELKFTDGKMGGNIGINCKPQFTRYSDIRVKGLMPGRQDVSIFDRTGNCGMGR
jgi:hypothetical protein